MIRDVEERGRSPRMVLAQFFNTVRPMHEAHVAPQREHADLVLRCEHNAGPAEADANALRIAAQIEALPQ